MTNQTGNANRTVNARRWVAAGTAVAASLVSVSAATAVPLHPDQYVMASSPVILIASEGGEGGEAGVTDTDTDDVAYLTGLGLIEGEVRAAIALHEVGEPEVAQTYLYRPGDEVYEQLQPGLKARGENGLAATIAELKSAAEDNANPDRLKQAHASFEAAIKTAGNLAKSGNKSRAMAIASLRRFAAKEYAAAYDDTKLENATEYHHSWGFLQVARRMAEDLSTSADQPTADAARAILEQIDMSAKAWPDLTAPEKQVMDPSVLHGAAARVEIAALKVK